MPTKYKDLVRAHMAKTGESWATAARHVKAEGAAANRSSERERAPEDRGPAAEAAELAGSGEREEDGSHELELADGASELAREGEREDYFTFLTDEADSDESVAGDEGAGALVDPPRPQRSAGPQALPSLSELLGALTLSQSKLKALTSADAGLYQRFSVPRRGGPPRQIAKPVPRLMAVQRRILELIVERLPAHDASHGFRIGRSTRTNAAVHVDSKLLVKVDFQDFSTAITMPRVRGVFLHAGYPPDVALALALLCTAPDAAGVRRLPQGAPTTPGLSNAVCFKLDRRLAGLASRLGWRFTRYGDDLTFSFPAGEKDPELHKLLGVIGRIVAEEGFRIHPKKTRVVRSGSSQKVTGLVVNGPGAPRLPRELRRRQRAAAHNLRRAAQTPSQPSESSRRS